MGSVSHPLFAFIAKILRISLPLSMGWTPLTSTDILKYYSFLSFLHIPQAYWARVHSTLNRICIFCFPKMFILWMVHNILILQWIAELGTKCLAAHFASLVATFPLSCSSSMIPSKHQLQLCIPLVTFQSLIFTEEETKEPNSEQYLGSIVLYAYVP